MVIHDSVSNIIELSKKMDIIKFTVNSPKNKIFPFLKLSNTKPKEGEDIFVIGNPKGLEYSVTNGIVSSFRNVEDFEQIIQITAPISSGNSGSPLINMKGEALGIVSFTISQGQNLNFAVSILNLPHLYEKFWPTTDEFFTSLPFPKIVYYNTHDNLFMKYTWETPLFNILNAEPSLIKKVPSDPRFPTYHSIDKIAEINYKVFYHFFSDNSLYYISYSKSNNSFFRSFTTPSKAINEFFEVQRNLNNLLGYSCYECIDEKLDSPNPLTLARFISCQGSDWFRYAKSITNKDSPNRKDIVTKANKFLVKNSSCDFTISYTWLNFDNNTKYTLNLDIGAHIETWEKMIKKGITQITDANEQDWDRCAWELIIEPIY